MIPYSRQNISVEDLNEVQLALKSDFLTQGPRVAAFENSLKEKFSVKYAVACSSGTAALHLSYASAGACRKTIGIVPAITFSATANGFRYLGAEVRFCDVNEKTGLLCPNSLASILEEITLEDCDCPGIISPVSFSGLTAPLSVVWELATKFGLKVIEDASHSPGSFTNNGMETYQSLSCAYSDAACLSFHPVKHICSGEGGAVLTNDEKLYNGALKLRSHGIERPNNDSDDQPWFYQQTQLGWNYRLTDFQAALGMSQLLRLDQQIERRRDLANAYGEAFSQSPFKECFSCPVASSGNSWHLYIIRFKKTGIRDQAYKFLKKRGIMTQVHYIPLYRHPYYEERYGKLRLPGAENFFESCLSIPMYPSLSNEEQKEVVINLGLFCQSLL